MAAVRENPMELENQKTNQPIWCRKKASNEHNKYQGWDADLLPGLGLGATHGVQP
jgi:hypothetical protein